MSTYKLFFLRLFGYILLMIIGMGFEVKYNFLSNIYYPEVEQQIEEEIIIPEYEEKVIKYFEVTEEDLYKVFYRFIHETIYSKRKHATEEYVSNVAQAYKDQVFYVPRPEVVFYNVAMAKRESHFDIKASPSTSSAAGFGQVIWKWHADKLSQQYAWRTEPITKEMLSTNIFASVDAQYIVFENYLKNNEFNYTKATNAYFGVSNSEAAQKAYRLNLLNEYNLLTQRLFRLVFQQQPKEKLLKVRCDTGDIIEEIIVTKESEKSE